MTLSRELKLEWARLQLLMIRAGWISSGFLVFLTVIPMLMRGQSQVLQSPVASSKGEAAGIIGLLIAVIGMLVTAVVVLWKKAERLEAQKSRMIDELSESTKAIKGIESELTRALREWSKSS